MLIGAESSPPLQRLPFDFHVFVGFILFCDHHRKTCRRQAMSSYNILDRTDLRLMAQSQSQLGQHIPLCLYLYAMEIDPRIYMSQLGKSRRQQNRLPFQNSPQFRFLTTNESRRPALSFSPLTVVIILILFLLSQCQSSSA